MIEFGKLDTLAGFARLRAATGVYDGRQSPANWNLIQRCTHRLNLSPERYAVVLYTRDVGHHTSGWWKNPDYERCRHLSLSCRDRRTGAPLAHDRAVNEEIARAFFGEDVRKVWIEGPYSAEGKASDVWHYRLFCDAAWQPIQPRGEVYSKAWTPADWRSFSEVHGYLPAREDAPFLLDVPDGGV